MPLKWSAAALIGLSALPGLTPLPAAAMDWTVLQMPDLGPYRSDGSIPDYPRLAAAPRGINIFLGTGEIVPGDAQTLLALIRQAAPASAVAAPGALPEVWLDSPGGDPFEGFRLGNLIRDLGMATVVPDGAFCASACTIVVLGGVERRVEGSYQVHAASPNESAEDLYSVLDQVQYFAGTFVSYADYMIGDPRVAEAALAFGAGGEMGKALPLEDSELRDWGVITVAARPSQAYDPASLQTIDCAEATPQFVSALVCNDVSLGPLDGRLAAAYAALSGLPEAVPDLDQQPTWVWVRDTCENVNEGPLFALPQEMDFSVDRSDSRMGEIMERFHDRIDRTGSDRVQQDQWTARMIAARACLVSVYTDRVRELDTLRAYAEAQVLARQGGWAN